MRYVATSEFMHDLFQGDDSRRTVVEGLFADSDIAAISTEHGVDVNALLAAIDGDEESEAGERLRVAVKHLRSQAADLPAGNAFPPALDRATNGGLELVGLFANPLMTTALILRRTPPAIDEVARAIDPRLSLASYASRVFRVLAVQLPSLASPLSNAAQALERA